MWILFRIGLVFCAILYRLIGTARFGIGNRQVTKQGHEFFVRQGTNKKGEVTDVTVTLPMVLKVFFRLIPENSTVQFFKKIGLADELQTGNVDFDTQFYVASDAPAFLRQLKQNSALIMILIELRRLGWKTVSSDGRGNLKLKAQGKIDLTDQHLQLLGELKKNLEQIRPQRGDIDRYFARAMGLELFMFICLTFAGGSLMSFYLDPQMEVLDPWPLYWQALYWGIGVFGVWFVLAVLLMRGSSRAPLLIFESALGVVAGVLIAAPQLAFDLNRAKDTSPARLTQATIVNKYTKTSGSGKKRSTSFYWTLKFQDEQFEIPSPFRVSGFRYNEFRINENIQFRIRQGYLQSPYIEQIEASTETWK